MEEKGIWRTVGGKRIFIADGEDLATAMKKSGKFKNNKNYQGEGSASGKASGTGKTVDKMKEELEKIKKDSPKILEKDEEAVSQIEKTNNEDDEIIIYRATPGDSINDGDWVFLSEKKAESWTKTPFGTPKPNFKVIKMKIKAKNADWTGKNLEFMYKE